MTFTTACSDSPSKLNVASSPLEPMRGGALSPPVPAMEPSAGLAVDGTLSASGLRSIRGATGVTQPASSVARQIGASTENRIGKVMAAFFCAGSFFFGSCGGFGAHLRAAGLDATADGIDLLFLGKHGACGRV